MAKEPVKWAIGIIDPKLIFTVERDLLKHRKYNIVSAYIPTIKVLKKQVKGKKHFQTLPLLFNYAFFKVPKYFIPNPHFLEEMKKDVECLLNWARDLAINKEQGFFTMDNLYNPARVALAKDGEIERIKEREERQVFYTSEDIKTLKNAKTITLHNYPFEGLPAEVIEVNEGSKYVKVRLLLGSDMSVMKVNFENVLFSIYREQYFDEKMKEDYIDELNSRHKNIENALQGKNYRRSNLKDYE